MITYYRTKLKKNKEKKIKYRKKKLKTLFF